MKENSLNPGQKFEEVANSLLFLIVTCNLIILASVFEVLTILS